jgi:hypothetical protein
MIGHFLFQKLVRLGSPSPKTAAVLDEAHAVQKRCPRLYVGSSRRCEQTYVSVLHTCSLVCFALDLFLRLTLIDNYFLNFRTS